MIFEEQFPSLKGKYDKDVQVFLSKRYYTIPVRKDFGVVFHKQIIAKCCLDKNKVKEAIEECKSLVADEEVKDLLDSLKKELGLRK